LQFNQLFFTTTRLTAAMMNDETATRFINWFKQHGTQTSALGLTSFPAMGRGAVALDDIPVSPASGKYENLLMESSMMLFTGRHDTLLNSTLAAS
jgi:hypothetical protein